MDKIIAVLIGGALGAVLRHYLGNLSADGNFPWGILLANLIGCFLIGLLYELAQYVPFSEQVRSFIFTGFLGALTTFSTFALHSVEMVRAEKSLLALANVGLHNAAGIFMVIAGAVSMKGLALVGQFLQKLI